MLNQGLWSWMPRRRLKTPDSIALITASGERFTYRELADQVDAIAGLLWQRNIRTGDSVAYLGENSAEFIATLFACTQIGAVFVPVNTRLAPPEILHAVSDSGAKAFIHDPEFSDRVSPILPQLSVEHRIETGQRGSEGEPGLNALITTAEPAPLFTAGQSSDPAIIIYTSGTTGKPKGAVLTHGNLTWVSMSTVLDYEVLSTDKALMISPLFHVASLGMGALPVIMKGGTIVLEKGFDAGRALELIEKHGITMLSGVPTTYQLLADHEQWAQTDLSSLSKLTCGGSAVPTRILNAFEDRGLSFSQGYGMTETSPGATHLSPEKSREKQGSVGLPHFFVNVRISSDEHGTPAATGEIGEIQITGPNVFSHYHGLPEATAAAFTSDGWFRSGDLGYLDEDGYLFIADRLKDMIISGGENIYPAEIENLLSDIDGVTGAAVIGVADDQWGEVPWAILTVREGTTVDTEQVRSFLDGKIARYKIPKRVIVVDEFPRTASGKIQKAHLRAQYSV